MSIVLPAPNGMIVQILQKLATLRTIAMTTRPAQYEQERQWTIAKQKVQGLAISCRIQ